MAEKIKLGRILLDAGIIAEEQIEQALAKQKEMGGRFGEALLELGVIKAEDIVWALSQQLDMPLIHVNASSVDLNAVAQVPIDIAKKYTLIPYLLLGDELTIIMDDPFKEEAVLAVQNASRRNVQLAVGMAEEITAIIDDVYEMAANMLDDPASKVKTATQQNLDMLIREIMEKPVSMIDLEMDGIGKAIAELGQRNAGGINSKLMEIFLAEPKLRTDVVKALGRIGGAEAESILIPATKFQENFTSIGHIVSAYNRDFELRHAALKGLGDLGTKKARSALKLMLFCWSFPLFRIFVFPLFKLRKVRPLIDIARSSLARVDMRLSETRLNKSESGE